MEKVSNLNGSQRTYPSELQEKPTGTFLNRHEMTRRDSIAYR